MQLTDKDAVIQPLILRNIVNRKATELGFKGLFALSTTKSSKNNLVVQLASLEARDFAYKSENTLREVLQVERVLEDNSYHKVVIYGIRTEDFNIEGGLQAIRQDLETYN